MELPSAPVATAHGKWQIVGFLKGSQACLTGLGQSECGSRPKGFKSAEEFVLGSEILVNHLILFGHSFVQICTIAIIILVRIVALVGTPSDAYGHKLQVGYGALVPLYLAYIIPFPQSKHAMHH